MAQLKKTPRQPKKPSVFYYVEGQTEKAYLQEVLSITAHNLNGGSIVGLLRALLKEIQRSELTGTIYCLLDTDTFHREDKHTIEKLYSECANSVDLRILASNPRFEYVLWHHLSDSGTRTFNNQTVDSALRVLAQDGEKHKRGFSTSGLNTLQQNQIHAFETLIQRDQTLNLTESSSLEERAEAACNSALCYIQSP